jgi:sterol desaturase/sphingolipid hydroxylase (fatty acid hydroxylase superfamily)
MAGPQQTLPLAGALAVLGVVLFAAERLLPLRVATRPLLRRLAVNALTSAVALLAAFLLVRPVAGTVLGWTTARGVGVVPRLGLSGVAAFAATFLLMDLSFYYWHRANHVVPVLWRFHNVHHLDPDLDVSTALRFHFGEILFSAAFRAAQVAAIGPSAAAYLAYEAVFQAETLFHHSNVRLPLGLERVLSRLVVTPRMHGIHHSQVQAEATANFSTVLNVWDRLHRSLRLDVPQAALAIGVPAYTRPDDNGFAALLAAPFRAQRAHWQRPDGAAVSRDPAGVGPAPTRLEA